ncbi:MAG: SufE family protein [Eggerthellaceae bacterium]|nr:SufE family protein [Eggerthellaceae bacterium]
MRIVENGTSVALEKRTINQQQDDIVEDFLSIGDPLSQYEYLIEFATALPALDEAFKVDENLVKDCQSRAWLVMENCAGALSIKADSDTLIVRGVLELLIEVLDGRPLREVAEADIYFPEKAELMTTFSASRRQGIGSIIATIKRFAQHACDAASEE